ncbi:hypothetical protein MNB_SV-15-508 [hydrothermal vent metagenome]|uniref:Thioredoxin domain-containing protein n=1 Tax=hydrothermal vent metagenome TaxID=652676 RepID=A0A1W1EJ11_9ZZZZ
MIEIDENLDVVMSEEFAKGNMVILQFTSELCDACVALEMELEEIDEKYDDISILSIDCNENDELVEYYDVYQTPTMIIFNSQKEMIYNGEGVMLYQDIEQIMGR